MANSSITKDYVEVFGVRKPVFVVTLKDDAVSDTQYYAEFSVAQKTVDLFELGRYTVDEDGSIAVRY